MTREARRYHYPSTSFEQVVRRPQRAKERIVTVQHPHDSSKIADGADMLGNWNKLDRVKRCTPFPGDNPALEKGVLLEGLESRPR